MNGYPRNVDCICDGSIQISSQRGFNPILSIRYALWRIRGRFQLRAAGVILGRGLRAFGSPVVSRQPNSEICLGESVTLISVSLATALGINHPVVLRTLAAGAKIRIGDRVGISGGSICAARLVKIGDDTLLGANVTITDSDFHSLHPAYRRGHSHPTIGVAEVRIGKRVLIGTNSIVLKGVVIGDNSVIGAGSVVTRSIPPNCIAAGNPCHVLRNLTQDELEGI